VSRTYRDSLPSVVELGSGTGIGTIHLPYPKLNLRSQQTILRAIDDCQKFVRSTFFHHL